MQQELVRIEHLRCKLLGLPSACDTKGQLIFRNEHFTNWWLNQKDNDDENACVNPLRNDLTATAATTFFAPCEGAAYTFPNDSAANSFGTCQDSATYVCCVGHACEANPNQPA